MLQHSRKTYNNDQQECAVTLQNILCICMYLHTHCILYTFFFPFFLFYFVYPTVIESLSLYASDPFLENQAPRLFYLIWAL